MHSFPSNCLGELIEGVALGELLPPAVGAFIDGVHAEDAACSTSHAICSPVGADSIPYNTLCMWSLAALTTGFLLCADCCCGGDLTRESSEDLGGVEEATVLALIAKLKPQVPPARLLTLRQDGAIVRLKPAIVAPNHTRSTWERTKPASKVTRANAQLENLNLPQKISVCRVSCEV